MEKYKKVYKLCIKPFYKRIIFCGLIMLIYSLSNITFPYFLKLIIDDAIGCSVQAKL